MTVNLFLKHLYGEISKGLFQVWLFNPITGEQRYLYKGFPLDEIDEGLPRLKPFQEKGFGVYFRIGIMHQKPEKRGGEEYTKELTALWAETDAKDFEGNKGRALEQIKSASPSIIVDSGGGYHGYWLLDKPYQLTSQQARDRVKQLMRGLAFSIEGDIQNAELSRSFRLPNTINTKPGRGAALVKIVQINNLKYDENELFDRYAHYAAPAKGVFLRTRDFKGHDDLPEWIANKIMKGAQEGERNREMFKLACQLRDRGISESAAIQYVREFNINSTPSEKGRAVNAAVKQAFKHSPQIVKATRLSMSTRATYRDNWRP
jgi:hypothetical protein